MTNCGVVHLFCLFTAATCAALTSEYVAEPTEAKTHLRGQATASLVESNASLVQKVDGVSVDLGFLTHNDSEVPAGDVKQNKALEDEVQDLFKMADLRKGMSREAFEATPFGSSVKKIYHLIEKVMMPKVEEAHAANQKELNKLAGEVGKCGSTKNDQVAKADQKKAMYLKYSPLHITCRAGEAGSFSEKSACWEEEADKKKIRDLKCKTFAMVSKQVGDQQASKQIMKKGGSESTESYVNRITSTVCGGCVGKNCKLKAGGNGNKKCGYDPYTCGCGHKCKYDKAKDDCDQATQEWQAHNKKCMTLDKQYSDKKAACDSLQDQMDDASCKRAVEMKDACESYAECYFDKKKAYLSLEKMVKKEETDRKAEWKGLKRMRCLIEAFTGGKVTDDEVNECKRETHSTDHLKIDYPKLPALVKCEVPHHYPNTPSYKADNFAPLPALAKGKQDAYECTGLTEISTTPAAGSPKTCKCSRVTLNGPYEPGPVVKCENCLDVRRSLEKNSCPDGTKLFSPRSRSDWKTFLASASHLRAPNFIIDITRPQNGCGGCQRPMNSGNSAQRSWTTSDNSAWWLRSTRNSEPNGDYQANCYLNIARTTRNENSITFNDARCNYHSKSYYCQASEVPLEPKKGSPDGCLCRLVTLNGKYSAGSLIKCTGCLRVSRSMQKNSCPEGTKIFSPRTREDWKTFIASATPLRSPSWIIDITQAQNGCGGCTRSPMKSTSPAQATWRTSDNSPWFLRDSRYSEPNGDYSANCYLNVKSAVSEDSVTFNDWKCNINSNAYYCQTVKAKKKPLAEAAAASSASGSDADDASADTPDSTAVAGPPQPKAGGKYIGLKCSSGRYTGLNSKCGNFNGLSEKECAEKCAEDASARDNDKCNKKHGVPDCVASVYDKAKKKCKLYRWCTALVEPKKDPQNIVTQIRPTYNPAAPTYKKMISKVCKGEPYTSPEGAKRGLKDTTEEDCWKACFINKWTGSRLVPVVKCGASVFYKKTGYCDFYEDCSETVEKKGVVLYKKLNYEHGKKKSSKEDDDEDEDEDEDDE